MSLYKRLLVPLDGSELAEVSLAHAAEIAKQNDASVALLIAVPPTEGVMVGSEEPVFLNELLEMRQKDAHDYLDAVAKRPVWNRLSVDTVVQLGPAAEAIIDYGGAHSIDLIIMATHGRSGIKRWVFGSVAEKVLRGAHRPVLLVPVPS